MHAMHAFMHLFPIQKHVPSYLRKHRCRLPLHTGRRDNTVRGRRATRRGGVRFATSRAHTRRPRAYAACSVIATPRLRFVIVLAACPCMTAICHFVQLTSLVKSAGLLARTDYQFGVHLSHEIAPLPPVENFPTVIGLSIVLSPLARRRLPTRTD